MTGTHIDRRDFLRLGGALGLTVAFGGAIPATGRAAGSRDPRLVVVFLRGALDGLEAVPPLFDPDYASLRKGLARGQDQCLPLDGRFGLHPALKSLARNYQAGRAAIVHACASPYRDRSHFDGQDVLESGLPSVGRTDTGWLNRLLSALPPAETVHIAGLAAGPVAPLIMRGPAKVVGWTPVSLDVPPSDLASRVMQLYDRTDPMLAGLFRTAQETAGAADVHKDGADPDAAMALGAARLMARDDGPRIAALSLDGWDTHAGEAGRLPALLTGLDGVLAALEQGLGPAWQDTAVLVVTEFGRTAAVNGTGGTDHGTATTAFLVGGAVKGGRIVTDWPGLKPAQLYQNRDLAPTTDLRAVAKGVIAGLYDMPAAALSEAVFPDSARVAPLENLIV
ncbi:DUF1501 domain-containing protein [Asticcacaulis solisilvae]|uniref:DUF1501 domain-containing protein n=1 Tax=Asticcacaulis solisilvae TaxID=1217274 RepID=UPI003FD6CC65